MSHESNIVWVNRLAWAHALMALCGAVKVGAEGELFWAGCWVIWAGLCLAFAMTNPRNIVRNREG